MIRRRFLHITGVATIFLLAFMGHGGRGAEPPRVLKSSLSPQAPASSSPTSAQGDKAEDLKRLEMIEELIRQAKFQESVPLLRSYLEDFPNSARAYYNLGYATFRTHDFGASITSLSKSLSIDETNPEAHKILGLDCSMVGRYDLAEKELLEAVQEKPGSAEIQYFLGRLFYTQGVFPLARKRLEAAIHIDPQYMKAWDNLGLTMEALGDERAALNCYTTAARLDEEQNLRSEWPYINVSAYDNRNHKPELALEYARKALRLNPRSDVAYFQMAKAFRTLGEWQKCAQMTQKAIDSNPRDPDYYFVLGIALGKMGRTKESRAALHTSELMHRTAQNDLRGPAATSDRKGSGEAGRLYHPDEP